MNQIITLLSQRLGLPEETVKSGLATILRLLKEKVSGSDFEKLINLIPGAADLLAGAPAPASSARQRAPGRNSGCCGRNARRPGWPKPPRRFSAFQTAGVPVDKIAPLARGFLRSDPRHPVALNSRTN